MSRKTLVFLILTVFVCSQVAYAEEVVEIPDPNLEAVIRETLRKPEEPITDTNLQGITRINSERKWNTPEKKRIEDITGLEYCANLQALYLDYNQISDVSALAGLTNLQVLSLYGNRISDISALAELVNLEVLNLSYNHQINDISALAGLTNPQSLGLGANQISNFSALAELTNLQRLDLSSNKVNDIQPLVDNSGIDNGDKIELSNNPLNYSSQKTLIPTLEGRRVTVDYRAKGLVVLDSVEPPTWSYTLTYQDGYIYNWFYEGEGITDASVTGEAATAGWTVKYSPALVIFSNSTPMTSGYVSGFKITGTGGGTGSWLVGRNTGSIEGPVIPTVAAEQRHGKLSLTFGELKRTALLQNYPNPFNPETWIPYQLAEPARVIIRIYTAKGELVKTLSLGEKDMGSYLNKEKAAYWGGMDSSGQRVTSGVYFYILQAGKFRATRKMALLK